jgi:hypothetical protein
MAANFALKPYARQALETAKEDLRRDGYLIPVAFIVLDNEILDFNIQFEGHERKPLVYAKLVEIAKTKNALAIITLNDANVTDSPGREPTAEFSRECIYLTVSGPAIRTWTVSVPYRRIGSEIIFGKETESSTDILNLLPEWTAHNSALS